MPQTMDSPPPTPTASTHPLKIYARWMQRTPLQPAAPLSMPPLHPCPSSDHYTVVGTPPRPLEKGQQVKLYALSPKTYHTPILHPSTPAEELDAFDIYDPNFTGVIKSVNTSSPTHAVLEIENIAPSAEIRRVFAAVRHAPGITIALRSGRGEEDAPSHVADISPPQLPVWAAGPPPELRQSAKPAFRVPPARSATHDVAGRIHKAWKITRSQDAQKESGKIKKPQAHRAPRSKKLGRREKMKDEPSL